MDFAFTQDQETLRAHLKELLDEVCPPEYAERCDNEAHPPREAYEALGKHGWFGLIVPVEYGGSGGSAIDLLSSSRKREGILKSSPHGFSAR